MSALDFYISFGAVALVFVGLICAEHFAQKANESKNKVDETECLFISTEKQYLQDKTTIVTSHVKERAKEVG